jgi:hypothetical protein
VVLERLHRLQGKSKEKESGYKVATVFEAKFEMSNKSGYKMATDFLKLNQFYSGITYLGCSRCSRFFHITPAAFRERRA